MEALVPAQGCGNCLRLQQQVDELQTQVSQLQQQIKELRSQLDQNSSNSHKPPSSDPPWADKQQKKPSGRKPGGQAGHQGHHRKLLPPEEVDEVVQHVPERCAHCQAFLSRQMQADDPAPHRHQVAELPPLSVVITEHQGHARRCGCCGKVTRQPIPREILMHVTGERLSALISYFSGRCHDGRRTVQEILEDVFGLPLALGTVILREQEMSRALAPIHTQAHQAVQQAPVRWVDETGWKQAGANRWLWTAASSDIACFLIDRKRNSQVLHHLVGQGSGGIVTSDRHTTYNALPKSRRQLCWAHFKREFVKWSQKSEQTRRLGTDGKALCQSVFALWRDFRQGKLSRRQLQRRAGPLRRRLRQLLNWHRRCADKQAAEFCRRIGRVQSALWTFLRQEHAEPTNNHAERMLRLAVLWRKNSFGCHSDGGCRFVERMLTVVQSLRLQGRSVLDFLHQTLRAHRQGSPPPSLAG